jgi:hypothetical protein
LIFFKDSKKGHSEKGQAVPSSSGGGEEGIQESESRIQNGRSAASAVAAADKRWTLMDRPLIAERNLNKSSRRTRRVELIPAAAGGTKNNS